MKKLIGYILITPFTLLFIGGIGYLCYMSWQLFLTVLICAMFGTGLSLLE